ncbi:putative outer membrane protein [Candidatus Termititenax aidoneus]|uniref:Outer membrane protein n=1 Tax=Termititenax aidoneus TaxID=2218524 RepID=A0A388TAC3_TERA1|nr:putative outer membrane protein [Candidatus Termititenax aidoneus]
MKKIILAVLSAALLWPDNNAADFLQTGLSARSLALGNAVTATGGHLDTAFSNPAALQDVEGEFFSAALHNFDLVNGQMFAAAGRIWPGRNPLVVGLVYAGSEINNIDRTLLSEDGRPVEIGSFDSFKHNGSLLLAYRLNRNFWSGFSLRRYFYALDEATAEATGLDLGWRWQLPNWKGNQFFTGASLRNLFRTKVSWSTGHYDTMPLGLNSGLAARRRIWGHPLLASLDCVWQEEQNLFFRSGLEYALDWLALRLGWDDGLTYGLGLRCYALTIDYAQTMHAELGLQQRVSLLFEL